MPKTSEVQTSAELLEADAMPRMQVRLADEQAGAAKPLPPGVTRRKVSQKSPAEWAYERLILYIQAFEERLDAEHEVAMGFAGSDTGVIRIEGVGFFDPDIVTFYGSDAGGNATQLVQHVTQLNVLLRSMPKARPQEAPRRIGFRLASELG